jgi:outer membrane biosynthesis protein TonB
MKNNGAKSGIFSFLLHIFFIFILYLIGKPERFNIDNEKFEIIDADIVGLVNQSKSKDVKIEEKIIKKETAPSTDQIEEKSKVEKIEKIEKKPEESEEKLQKESEVEKIPEEKKEENIIPEKKKEEEKKVEEKKTEEKKDEIPKGENKKIDDILKEIEKKDQANELKKSLEKTNKALNELEKKKEIINKNVQSTDKIGGGDIATAKLGSYIKSQLIACWKIPPLVGIEIEKIFVIVQIKLDKDGNILNSKIVNKGQYGQSQFFEIISESAIQAVNSCSPIKNLPKDRYEEWKEVQLVFDPSKFIS